MTALLWCIGAAAALVATAAIALHIDLIRTARRAHRVQADLNRPGR